MDKRGRVQGLDPVNRYQASVGTGETRAGNQNSQSAIVAE